MPRAICKLVVNEVTDHGYQDRIVLRAQYDEPLTAEDAAFSKATPDASMVAGIENPALRGGFKPGQVYYVELIPEDEYHAANAATDEPPEPDPGPIEAPAEQEPEF
jgi:hypothetical protein